MIFCSKLKKQELPGMILSIDFEKACNMISWNFIDESLKYYNFESSIRNWVKMFQTGSESCVIQNGHISETIKLKRGCRQGAPISRYLFFISSRGLGGNVKR